MGVGDATDGSYGDASRDSGSADASDLFDLPDAPRASPFVPVEVPPPLTVTCVDGLPLQRIGLGSDAASAAVSSFFVHRGATYFTAAASQSERGLFRLRGEALERLVIPGERRPIAIYGAVSVGDVLSFVGYSRDREDVVTTLYRIHGEDWVEVVPFPDGVVATEPELLGETLFIADDAQPASLWRLHPDQSLFERVSTWGSASYSYLSLLGAAGHTLYFAAFDEATGVELWRVSEDGPAEQVADLRAGPESSLPGPFQAIGTTAYFIAWQGPTTDALWRIDEDGDVEVLAEFSGGGEYHPKRWSLWDWNGVLYYSGVHAGRSWDIGRIGAAGSPESWPERLTFTWAAPFDDQLIFSSQAYDMPQRLWRTSPGEGLSSFHDLRNRTVGRGRAHGGYLYAWTTYDDRLDDDEPEPSSLARFDAHGQLTMLRDVCPDAAPFLGDRGPLFETSDGRLIVPAWDEEQGSVLWLLGGVAAVPDLSR